MLNINNPLDVRASGVKMPAYPKRGYRFDLTLFYWFRNCPSFFVWPIRIRSTYYSLSSGTRKNTMEHTAELTALSFCSAPIRGLRSSDSAALYLSVFTTSIRGVSPHRVVLFTSTTWRSRSRSLPSSSCSIVVIATAQSCSESHRSRRSLRGFRRSCGPQPF